MSELIERLRAASSGLCSEDPHKYMARGITAGDCLEAADELTALRSQVSELRADLEVARGALNEIPFIPLTHVSGKSQ